jgi:hypothetical protein
MNCDRNGKRRRRARQWRIHRQTSAIILVCRNAETPSGDLGHTDQASLKPAQGLTRYNVRLYELTDSP